MVKNNVSEFEQFKRSDDFEIIAERKSRKIDYSRESSSIHHGDLRSGDWH